MTSHGSFVPEQKLNRAGPLRLLRLEPSKATILLDTQEVHAISKCWTRRWYNDNDQNGFLVANEQWTKEVIINFEMW